MPQFEHDAFLALDPADTDTILGMKAFQYDIVCNGVELSSGAIRNHRPDVMKKAFALAGYDETVLEERFGGMYRAFQYGAPPHGGIAPGVDRIVMLLAGEENLREIVLFPMNQRAEDLLMSAPSPATPKQLRELHIRLAVPELAFKQQELDELFRKASAAGGSLNNVRVAEVQDEKQMWINTDLWISGPGRAWTKR
jgi:aspartyl-tRNA synthetase